MAARELKSPAKAASAPTPAPAAAAAAADADSKKDAKVSHKLLYIALGLAIFGVVCYAAVDIRLNAGAAAQRVT